MLRLLPMLDVTGACIIGLHCINRDHLYADYVLNRLTKHVEEIIDIYSSFQLNWT